jgi:serine/threonine protein kinase
MNDIKIDSKYKIVSILGEGAYGKVYAGVNTRTREEVAIKLEKIHDTVPLLEYEYNVLAKMDGEKGFPVIHFFGTEGDYICLVTSLLGPDFLRLFKFCEKRFSLKTILSIAQ